MEGKLEARDPTNELYREYEFIVTAEVTRVYRIDKTVSLHYREGGTTHRVAAKVLDALGAVWDRGAA